MRIRSAARSNSCLHLCEQKKYRRFLYSLQGVASPLSTAAPQMGSYDRPFVLLSPEFTCLPPRPPSPPTPWTCSKPWPPGRLRQARLPAPEALFCKLDAALTRAVSRVTLREALPRVGILL